MSAPATSLANTPLCMRELLRDTALQVSLMSQASTVHDFDTLRARCVQLAVEFDLALRRFGVDDPVRDDAAFAQCALFDETALLHLGEVDRAQWELKPIQVERFGRHDAGDHVFARLAIRMAEARPSIALLECYATVLGLGFKGRHAVGGKDARQALIGRLNDLLAAHRPPQDAAFIVDTSRRWRIGWLSPVAGAFLACAFAIAVYFICVRSLDAEMNALMLTAR